LNFFITKKPVIKHLKEIIRENKIRDANYKEWDNIIEKIFPLYFSGNK
jgi:hypothetical protein